MSAPHIVLVGLMGVGKTSVGRMLARELNRPFIDTDAEIESRAGRMISEIFAADGEASFRQLEATVLAEVLESRIPAVVATGGGIVESAANRSLLVGHRASGVSVVWLQASVQSMVQRTARSSNRPLLAAAHPRGREGVLGELLARRAPLYTEVATQQIGTDGRAVPRIVREIMSGIREGLHHPGNRPKPTTVAVALGDRAYDIVVGSGAVTELGRLIPRGVNRAVIVTQTGIPSIPEIDLPTHLVHIPDGEQAKTLSTIEHLCREFARFGLTRNDLVIGVGGGLVTDVAGFAAASWHRGTRVVHVATTLLAMVDAAIGGKTGVNLPEGKNLVGAFWQPSAVVCDTDYLETLSERELRCGWGEVAKYHFLTGDDMLSMSTDQRVARCARIKADIVAEDEREGGRRALLNYGHTFGHAIETVTGHEFAHGEAVAIGMICAAHLARLMGRIDDDRVERHYAVLDAYGLRSALPAGLDHQALVSSMARDKKATNGLVFILDGADGLETVMQVDPALVVQALVAASGVR